MRVAGQLVPIWAAGVTVYVECMLMRQIVIQLFQMRWQQLKYIIGMYLCDNYYSNGFHNEQFNIHSCMQYCNCV